MKSLSENSAGSSSELQTSSWPSRTSILETPERTRCRLSISFADSGLGSSMFGSPPNSQETVSTSPPVLRTPTGSVGGSISRPKRSTSPSPIRNFVHMSPYSSSFSSPIHGSSPSRLQLSNPEHATGFRFSGANLRKGELFDNLTNFEARKNECSATTSSPHHTKRTTGSRVINRCLNMPSVSSNRENAVECVEESSADQTIPYTNAEPETPSKCFGDESLDRSMFEDGDFTVFGTSTPLRDDEGFHYFSRFASTVGTYYADLDCIPEQANGPLESSLCDLRSGLPDPGVPFLRPYLPISKMVDAVSSKPLSELDNIIAVNKEVARTMHSKDLTTVHHFSRDTNKLKPFRPPVKRLKPFSRRWLQITFGETDHQVEMTRLAHSFLRSVETTEENVDVSE